VPLFSGDGEISSGREFVDTGRRDADAVTAETRFHVVDELSDERGPLTYAAPGDSTSLDSRRYLPEN
jgi:hypothetical protein